MPATLGTVTFLFVFPFAFYARTVVSHSHLADPLPTRQLHCRVGGDARACHGPCPTGDDYGRLNPVNKHQPAEVWGRGATVNVRWHRDNRKFSTNPCVLGRCGVIFNMLLTKCFSVIVLASSFVSWDLCCRRWNRICPAKSCSHRSNDGQEGT